jgi:hypothetical protein
MDKRTLTEILVFVFPCAVVAACGASGDGTSSIQGSDGSSTGGASGSDGGSTGGTSGSGGGGGMSGGAGTDDDAGDGDATAGGNGGSGGAGGSPSCGTLICNADLEYCRVDVPGAGGSPGYSCRARGGCDRCDCLDGIVTCNCSEGTSGFITVLCQGV